MTNHGFALRNRTSNTTRTNRLILVALYFIYSFDLIRKRLQLFFTEYSKEQRNYNHENLPPKFFGHFVGVCPDGAPTRFSINIEPANGKFGPR